MCDFHSIIVGTDGRLYHNPSNSHSGIAREFGLTNGPDKREFYECEWDGKGSMPVNLVRDRSYGTETGTIPSIVERTAVRHYEKLVAILNGESELVAPFDGPNYRDVQERAEEAQALKKVQPLADILGELSEASAVAVLQKLIEDLSLPMEEIAASEIESAVESATEDLYTWESAVECILNSGDYYSSDDVDEKVQEAKQEGIDEATEEMEEKIETVRQEGYIEGFLACKNGAKPEIEYINGLPGFLFG